MENSGQTATGRLGVPYLEQVWSRTATQAHETSIGYARRWAADQLVIYGLGVGLQETFSVRKIISDYFTDAKILSDGAAPPHRGSIAARARGPLKLSLIILRALSFLYGRRPSLEAFEDWILERNGGHLDPEQISRVNEAVARVMAGAETDPGLPEGFEPVLTEEDLRFWDENGYVVLRRAVEPDAAAAAAEAIWTHLGMNPDSQDSWYDGSRCEGIMVPLVRHPSFDENRRASRIRRAFAQLLGTDDLAVTVDRGGFNPPERPGFCFRGQRLHWDTSLIPPIPLHIQGVLYLTDTRADQGAFECVPGFHRRIDHWLATLPSGADPRAQDLSAEAVCVAGRAGDMVLWQAALPHGASPNCGLRPRLVQYITWWPSGKTDARAWR